MAEADDFGEQRGEIRIAICSKILQEYDMLEAIEIAAGLGYEGMEIFGVPRHLPENVDDELVEETANQLFNYGMACVTLCTYVGNFAQKSDAECEAELGKFRRYLDIAERLDCRMIRVLPGGPPRPENAREDHWLRAAYYLRECCDMALGRGIDVIVENNFGLTATVDATLHLINLVDRPNLGVNYDPGNLFRMDKYYGVEALARFGTLVFNVQVKDCAKSRGVDEWQLLLGEGEVDYKTIFTWLLDHGYVGFVSAESHREPDDELSAIDIARHEFAALRSLLEEA
ncbi:MAG: sugar phosphate isomerase/epimerase [Armatimonadetes bacterium]|nr:sugar phosphate isomerase/epimerase [Armatimonadota bacterium]